MKIEIDIQLLENILLQLTDDCIRDIFWYVFGFSKGRNNLTFFEAVTYAIAGKKSLKVHNENTTTN